MIMRSWCLHVRYRRSWQGQSVSTAIFSPHGKNAVYSIFLILNIFKWYRCVENFIWQDSQNWEISHFRILTCVECLNSGVQGRSHGHSGRGGGGTMYVYKGDLENKRMASRLISCSEYEAVVCNVDPNKYVKFIRDIVAHWRFPVCFVWL